MDITIAATWTTAGGTIQTPGAGPKTLPPVETDGTVTLHVSTQNQTDLQTILTPGATTIHLTADGLAAQYTISELIAALTVAETSAPKN